MDRFFIPLIAIAIILSGCNDQKLAKTNDTHEIVYYRSDSHDNIVYDEALIDIKDQYPKEVSIEIFYENQLEEDPYHVKTFPSLYVVKNEEVLVKIRGEIKEEKEIIEKVQQILVPEKESQIESNK
ncbi:hypothetical protein LC087_03635 [Bacillus carboniphilus]|uniref:Small peptidoglycan-associated lipoprotein n=1 Tax=Bacillus carboniphilus TaxID=86663 RepID=A0ABY9K0B5_9BACI|nr:hypothetical protein [Bacillus carboniphilus]WLR43295.1 hypothetical protein LC087_03635 [Bacillus carboniphilus]